MDSGGPRNPTLMCPPYPKVGCGLRWTSKTWGTVLNAALVLQDAPGFTLCSSFGRAYRSEVAQRRHNPSPSTANRFVTFMMFVPVMPFVPVVLPLVASEACRVESCTPLRRVPMSSSTSYPSLSIQAGPKALAHLHANGLHPGDIATIPAAAGGPKGLIFQKLDQWLFGTWLPSAAPRQRLLLGASIGAWRMAAACCVDPVAAFQRLGDTYCQQSYPSKPTAQQVTEIMAQMLVDVFAGHEQEVLNHPHHRLQVIASRGSALLTSPRSRITTMAGFGLAVASNLVSRSMLRAHLERVVFCDPRADAGWVSTAFDRFTNHVAPLAPDNLQTALLASGTLPFIMAPVRDVPHGPKGSYWDGGLIDYHLDLPYCDIAPDGLVLYPHFGERIVPGWFDKPLRQRRAGVGARRHWLDNVILVSPSDAFIASLPRAKLPDRNDFGHHGLRHDVRIADWKRAMQMGSRLAEDLARFVERPDMHAVKPFA
ncbi:MAG: patatin-like phospholipase family protein [Herminiimonas sp.]|nr:patatin-like phospholipase family protein [Herminiimonas sp.]